MKRRDFLRHVGVSAAMLGGNVQGAPDGPAKPRIKVGQIGVGHAHATKLSVYRRSPDYEVVGVVESDETLRKRAESTPAYKDLNWLTREQLLNVSGLQTVLVETRVSDLLDTAEVCITAGKHVHIDKPAGESLLQFRRILDSAAKQKLLVQMGYMYRYNPGILLLRELLAQNWLGEVFEVHTVMSKVVDRADRKELAKFKGGIMFEIGCHVIDLVIGVLGKPKEVTSHIRHVAKLDDGLADNMLAVFEYPKAVATVKSSAVEVEGTARRHLAVCGTEGTIHLQPLDNPSARVAFVTAHGGYKTGYQDIELPKYERYVADAADMARVIRGEKASDFASAHDLAVQESLLKACRMPIA